jgi:hypothetical protein
VSWLTKNGCGGWFLTIKNRYFIKAPMGNKTVLNIVMVRIPGRIGEREAGKYSLTSTEMIFTL